MSLPAGQFVEFRFNRDLSLRVKYTTQPRERGNSSECQKLACTVFVTGSRNSVLDSLANAPCNETAGEHKSNSAGTHGLAPALS